MAEQTPDSGLVKTSSDAGLPNPNPDPNPNPNPNPNPEPLYNCTLYAKSFPYLRPGSNLRTEAAVSSCAVQRSLKNIFYSQKFEQAARRTFANGSLYGPLCISFVASAGEIPPAKVSGTCIVAAAPSA